MGPTTSNYTTLVASWSLEKVSLTGLVTQPPANNIIEVYEFIEKETAIKTYYHI